MRLSSSRSTAILHRPQQDFLLWDKAGTRPSLDQQFADRKDLIDAISGQQLITHTRASSGTCVGSDGLIKTATTNLFTHSQEFNNAASWVLRNASTGLLPVVTANVAIAPDGTLTADRIVFNLSGAGRSDIYHNAFSASGVQYTTSIWLKSATGTNQTIYLRTQGNVVAITVTPTWQRFSGGGTVSDQSQFGLRDIYTGPVTSADIYAWGAQLEQSSTVGEYIPTTSTINSAPRFDHDPVTGESLGLLVEESRTNLLLWSEDFRDTADAGETRPWFYGRVSITPDSTIAPDGNLTSDKFVEDTQTGPHYVSLTRTPAAAHNETWSVFVKPAERSFCIVGMGILGGRTGYPNLAICVNLTNGNVESVNGTPVFYAVEKLQNNWFKISLTGLTTTNPGDVWVASAVDGSTANLIASGYTGDDTSGIYIWGAQVEVGSFPTSYIPTTSSTVTRAADAASITGANFSSWYRQDEGSFYAEATAALGTELQTQGIFGIDNGVDQTANYLAGRRNNNQFRLSSRVSSSIDADISIGTQNDNTFAKTAYRVKTNDYALFTSTGVSGFDTSVTIPAGMAVMDIGNHVFGGRWNSAIKRLTYWPLALPDSTLQALTQ